MCHLTELDFSCGHKQLIPTGEPCASAFRRKTTPSTQPPDFCRSAITISKTLTSPKACKEDCPRKEAYEALLRRYREAIDKIEKVSERAEAIKSCVAKGERPKTNFSKLAEQGWDPVKLRELCYQSLSQIPELLFEFSITKKKALIDLDAAHSAAKSSVREYTIEGAGGTVKEIVYFEGKGLEKMGIQLRDQLHDCVCEIERRASEACLEKVGWKFSKGGAGQLQLLRAFGAWKRGVLSGSRMDDAYIGRRMT